MNIQKNFRDAVNALNHQPTTSQITLPFNQGRAYPYDRQNTYYGDQIHIKSVGEEQINRIHAVSKLPHLKNGIYAGAAGLVNLAYMGAAKSSAGILYDLNAHQKIFWDIFLDAMAASPTLGEFQSQMPSVLKQTIFSVNALEACENMEAVGQFTRIVNERKKLGVFAQGETPKQSHTKLRAMDTEEDFFHWMKNTSDQGDAIWHRYYPHLHQMAKAGAIGTMTLDISDEEGFDQLETLLSDLSNGEKITIFYVSNIFRFLNHESDFAGRPNDIHSTKIISAERNLTQVIDPQNGIIIGDHFCLNHDHENTTIERLARANQLDAKYAIS